MRGSIVFGLVILGAGLLAIGSSAVVVDAQGSAIATSGTTPTVASVSSSAANPSASGRLSEPYTCALCFEIGPVEIVPFDWRAAWTVFTYDECSTTQGEYFCVQCVEYDITDLCDTSVVEENLVLYDEYFDDNYASVFYWFEYDTGMACHQHQCETPEVEALETQLELRDLDGIAALLSAESSSVRINRERGLVQAFGCAGTVVAQADISTGALRSLLDLILPHPAAIH